MSKSELYVAVYDLHFPKVDWPTWNAVQDFLKQNEVKGFVFGGDQFDNEEISHHTKGKPIFRERAAFKKNETGFKEKILKDLEKNLSDDCERVWIVGNHDRFERDLIECQPELEGMIERVESLELEKNGWKVVPLGHAFKKGHLAMIHGEVLTGIGNQAGAFPSKKAVDIYAGNVLAGHTHSPQSYTRVSPVDSSEKWMGWISPVCSNTNPTYLRNRPTAWVNGFTIVEFLPRGTFNLFPIVVCKGKFAYGGKIYGGKK